VSRELIRAAVGKVYNRYFEGVNMQPVVQWFDIGGNLKLEEDVNSADVVRQLSGIQGLMEKTRALGLTANEPDAVRASAGEFILEGLYAQRKISRSEERGFTAEERKRQVPDPEDTPRARQRRQFN
jgi:magnesium chelatase subunit I